MNSMKTGNLIATIRRNKKMTQKDLANQLHVSDKAVSKWERGESYPDVSILVHLAAILDITVDELLEGTIRNDIKIDNDVKVLSYQILVDDCQMKYIRDTLISVGIISCSIIAFFSMHFGTNLSIEIKTIISSLFVLVGISIFCFFDKTYHTTIQRLQIVNADINIHNISASCREFVGVVGTCVAYILYIVNMNYEFYLNDYSYSGFLTSPTLYLFLLSMFVLILLFGKMRKNNAYTPRFIYIGAVLSFIS